MKVKTKLRYITTMGSIPPTLTFPALPQEIAVSMREGGDILKLGERLNTLMPELVARYPWGIKIDKVWYQADLVENVRI